MRIVLFCHSLLSDWNHGNAHFLRGIVGELKRRGHEVRVFEPADGWSLRNLLIDSGEEAIADFRAAYPGLRSTLYDPATIDLDATLESTDLVIVHEWADHELVRRLGRRRRSRDYRLLFHDTHHRAITAPAAMAAYDLTGFDGVLVFGEILRRVYLERGWARTAWTLHEAADTAVFRPQAAEKSRDLVWVGNWGDDERTRELGEYLLGPVRDLGLRATVHGVRYPPEALKALVGAGIAFGGHVANHRVPQVFARHHIAIHVPRRPYAQALPGIPTIRVFEALACGIPLVCAPWNDAEHLFAPGADFLLARDGAEMRRHLRALIGDPDYAASVAEHGRRTVLARHTCAHRVDELLKIAAEDLGLDVRGEDRLACVEV
jgi:spore maturation protein CgeB